MNFEGLDAALLMKLEDYKKAKNRADIEQTSKVIWEVMDHNKDGKVTHEEYLAFCNAICDMLGSLSQSTEEAAAAFAKDRAEAFDPSSPESPAAFLKVADPENKGFFDFDGQVAGECNRFKITLDGSDWVHDLVDFDFVVETLENGQTRVALRQPIPLKFEEMVVNPDLFVRMFKAHGLGAVTAVKINAKIEGGLSQENRAAVISFEDGSTKKIFIKGTVDKPTNVVQKNFVEVFFYAEIYDSEL